MQTNARKLLLSWIVSTWTVVTAIPIDNGVEGTPEITCGESFVAIRWQTRNTFEGHAFVKGRYGEPGCRTGDAAVGKKEVEIKLPFTSCGLRRTRSANPRGVFVSVTVVISFHPQLITKVDRAYMVQCFYMEAVKTVTAELEVSMLTTSFQTQTVPMPICRYEVLEGSLNGSPVKYAKIGDQVYHKWTCDTEAVDTFCMIVHSCTVEDGSGNNILLLDANGCAQDKYLLGNLEYINDLTAGKESHVFKYADRSSLYFNCQVSIGVREQGQQCPKPQCQEPQRGKRSSNISSAPEHLNSTMMRNSSTEGSDVVDVSSDPITVMDLDPKTESSNKVKYHREQRMRPKTIGNREPEAEDDICLSVLGFSGYAALNAAMTIISLSLFTAVYKRTRK